VVSWAVFTAFELLSVVTNFLDWQSRVSHGQPDVGVPVGAMALLAVALVALAGVWFWQRKAVYLLAVAVAVLAVYDSWFGLAALALLIRLVLIGALAWCIRQKWQSFR
jgi:hypothetical protein